MEVIFPKRNWPSSTRFRRSRRRQVPVFWKICVFFNHLKQSYTGRSNRYLVLYHKIIGVEYQFSVRNMLNIKITTEFKL